MIQITDEETYYDYCVTLLKDLRENLQFEVKKEEDLHDELLRTEGFAEQKQDITMELGGRLEELLVVMLDMAKRYKNNLIFVDKPRNMSAYLLEHAKVFADELESIRIQYETRGTRTIEDCFKRAWRRSERILGELQILCNEMILFTSPKYDSIELVADYTFDEENLPKYKEDETVIESIERTRKSISTFIILFVEMDIQSEKLTGFIPDPSIDETIQMIEEKLFACQEAE